MTASPSPCPWCGSFRGVVHVHGHGQCLTCNTNVEPCCAGDSANDAGTTTKVQGDPPTMPSLFPTLFQNLGGDTVTVTTEALLFALSNRLGSDYEEAHLVLTAAERIGIVLTEVPGRHRLGVVAPTPVDPRSPPP